MRIGSEKHFHWLWLIIAATIVLNLTDAVLTLMWWTLGAATEANPLMAVLLSWGEIPFVLGKLALVSGGSYLLWNHRHRAFAVISIFLAFLVYYFILLQHLKVMNLYLLQHLWSYPH